MLVSSNRTIRVPDIPARDALELKVAGMRVIVTNASLDPNAEGEATYIWDVLTQTWSLENSESEQLEKLALKTTDIGVTVQGYDPHLVSDPNYVHTDNNFTTAEKTQLSNLVSDSAGTVADFETALI